MALKGPTPVDLPAALLTPVEYGSRVRPNYALHYATRHDTPLLLGSSTILEAATGSGSGIRKDLEERLKMSGIRRNAGLVARACRRKELKRKTLGLKELNFNYSHVVKLNLLYQVSIEDRLTLR